MLWAASVFCFLYYRSVTDCQAFGASGSGSEKMDGLHALLLQNLTRAVP